MTERLFFLFFRTVLLTGVFEHYMGLELNDTTTFYPTEILFNMCAPNKVIHDHARLSPSFDNL